MPHSCELIYGKFGEEPPAEILEPCYGTAFNVCIEDKRGRLWVHNGEYGSQVNFCPVCGYKAPTQGALEITKG